MDLATTPVTAALTGVALTDVHWRGVALTAKSGTAQGAQDL